MPHLPQAQRALYLPRLQQAMREFSITGPLRAAAFLAQIAHESGELRWLEELWGPTAAQRRYEPPSSLAKRLGNTQPGDGLRFKGRGPLQITGRANYKRYGDMLGVDLITNPEFAATPEVAFRIAGLYWQGNNLNELADKGRIRTITKRINGGFNNLAERLRYYKRAKEVLGAPKAGGRSDAGDDSSAPRFEKGFESTGEITLTADKKSATKPLGGNSSVNSKAGKASAKKATTAEGNVNTKKNRTKKRTTKKRTTKKRTAMNSVTKKRTSETSKKR